MAQNSLKAKTLSSLFWKFFERGGRAVVELIVQIILARLLSPDDFGTLAIMLVFVNIGNVLVQSGLNTALIQAPSITDEDSSTVFWLCFGVSLALYLIVFLAAPGIASFYVIPSLVWPLRAMCLILVVSSFNSVQVALVERELEFRKVFDATLIAGLVSGSLGIASALLGAGLWSLVIQQVSYHLCNCVVLAHSVKWLPQMVFDLARARTMLGFGWKLLVSGVLDQGYQSLSDLIIGKQFSASSLGLVSQGKKYPQALGNILDGAIQPVMLSAVAHVQSDLSQVKRLVRRALKTSTYLIAPAMTLFAVAAEPIVTLVLGDQWLPCVPFMRMYCFTYALLPIHTTNLQTLNGMGRSDLFLKLELIKKCYGTACLLIAAFVFRDVYVMVGTYMFTGIISTFVNGFPNKRVIGYSYGEQLRDIAPSFLLSIIAGGLSLVAGGLVISPVLKIVVEALVMAAVYLGLSAVLRLEVFVYLRSSVVDLLRSRK